MTAPLSQAGSTPARRQVRAAAAPLAWGLLFFLAGQAGLGLALYHWKPQLRDPEYGLKLQYLREQIAERPGRPVVVVLGSSRVAMGLRPAALAGCWPEGQEPVVFNYSLIGAGPVLELLCLHRLLADGIRPDWVFIECWPPFWHQEGIYSEDTRLDVNRLAWRDVPLLERYQTRPRSLSWEVLQGHLAPWFAHRFILLSRYAPSWVAWTSRRDDGWRGLDRHGWLARKRREVTAADRRRAAEQTRLYFQPLCTSLEIADISDKALAELLALCRREGIRPALLVMPEGKEFQGLYPPEVRSRVDAYLAQVQREQQIPVFDTRDWMADDDFIDGFHLLPAGAAAFTLRLGREVLRPLLSAPGSQTALSEPSQLPLALRGWLPD